MKKWMLVTIFLSDGSSGNAHVVDWFDSEAECWSMRREISIRLIEFDHLSLCRPRDLVTGKRSVSVRR